MNDLEEELTQRLRSSAGALHITPPSPWIIVERVARRRRRRLAARGAAGVTIAVLMIGGLAAINARDGRDPAPSGHEPQPSTSAAEAAPTSRTDTTLDVPDATPAADHWSRLPENALAARSEHLVVATGAGLFVWGSYGQQAGATDGAFYDDATRTWRMVPPAPLATDRGDALGVWTGTEVVVINGTSGNVKSAAFNPTTFTWRALSDPPVDNAANGASQAVFVDGDVLLFSIFEDGAGPDDQVARLDDLQSGHWTVVPPPPVSLRSSVGVVAAGTEAFVVGQSENPVGCSMLHVLAYSPSGNSWRELPAGSVANRADPVTVWTGSELFIGGGGSCDNGVAATDLSDEAVLLDPTTQQSRPASRAPIGFYSSYRYPDMWTGTSVATLTPDGRPLLYNPASDTWHLGPTINGANPVAPNQTPIVATDGTIVVSGGRITQAGELCCDPFRGTYAYTVPAGF